MKFIRATARDIADKIRARRINRTATILVGRMLEPANFRDSNLYDREQGPIYRPRRGRDRGGTADSREGGHGKQSHEKTVM